MAVELTTDYLIIGAGISGLAFADELLTRTQDSMVIVDKRDVPGGHWNDTYPFVKLHQTSTFYGVESRELSDGRIDESGPNKGFLSLASGPEILSYIHSLTQTRLVPSGRVTYLPSTELLPDGKLRGVYSGKQTSVKVKKRVVDATWYTNKIPATHTRRFAASPDVSCIPPNNLPRISSRFSAFTVLGAGKTGIDACVWLLTNGTPPERIRWIIPNDYWYVNRAKTQPGDPWFHDVFSTLTQVQNNVAQATNVRDLAFRHEMIGFWMRLDPDVEPFQFRAAVVSPGEMEQLRRVKDVVRKGRVTAIRPGRLILQGGEIAAPSNSLYVDCTASAIEPRPLVPVFQPNKIVLQLIRFPQIPFSMAMIAFLESLDMSDEEKNSFAAPVPFRSTIDDYVVSLASDMQNRLSVSRHPVLKKWVRESRLDGFAAVVRKVKPSEMEKISLLQQLRDATVAAGRNLPRLVASVQSRSSL